MRTSSSSNIALRYLGVIPRCTLLSPTQWLLLKSCICIQSPFYFRTSIAYASGIDELCSQAQPTAAPHNSYIAEEKRLYSRFEVCEQFISALKGRKHSCGARSKEDYYSSKNRVLASVLP